MSIFEKDNTQIKRTLRSYERKLAKEKEQFGSIRDGAGKRYLLGPLYMMLGDNDGAIESFKWYESTFSDDTGDPFQYLTWILALYRHGDLVAAENKMLQTMFTNLYLIPHLLNVEIDELDIWHGSNLREKGYLYYVPPELLLLWRDAEIEWLDESYHQAPVMAKRERYIEISHKLNTAEGIPARTKLSAELDKIMVSHL